MLRLCFILDGVRLGMLIEFEVENYLSFRDRATFSLERTSIREHPEHIFKGRISVLSGATIYGANASGKSNLFLALRTAIAMVKHNKDVDFLGLPRNSYMSVTDSPTSFSFIFQSEKNIYKYFFSVRGGIVLEERLFLLDKNKNIRTDLIKRKAGITPSYNDKLDKIEWYKYRTTAEGSLLLPKLKTDGILERNEKCVTNYREAFSFFDSFIFTQKEYNYLEMPAFYLNLKKDDFKTYLLNLLKSADLGITGIRYQPIHEDAALPFLKMLQPKTGKTFLRDSNGNFYYLSIENEKNICEKLVLLHGEQQFDMCQESEGTLKLIELSLAFYITRKARKSILIIDELGSSLHPKLVQFLLQETLKDLQTTKSQIIVTSHDLYMLSEKFWRKDQIWFTEKEASGNSVLTCLSSIDTRHDKSVYRSYLKGLYGALPILPTEAL